MRQQKYFLWKNVFSKRQLETVTYVRSYLDRSRLSQPACFRDTFNHLKQHWFIQLQFNLQDSWNSNCQICQTHRRRLRRGFQQLPITNNLLTRKKSSFISTNKLPEKWSSEFWGPLVELQCCPAVRSRSRWSGHARTSPCTCHRQDFPDTKLHNFFIRIQSDHFAIIINFD